MEAESVFAEPLEDNPYIDMTTRQLIPLVKGIYSIMEEADKALNEGAENAENWVEIKDFLEGVLADIEASRQ